MTEFLRNQYDILEKFSEKVPKVYLGEFLKKTMVDFVKKCLKTVSWRNFINNFLQEFLKKSIDEFLIQPLKDFHATFSKTDFYFCISGGISIFYIITPVIVKTLYKILKNPRKQFPILHLIITNPTTAVGSDKFPRTRTYSHRALLLLLLLQRCHHHPHHLPTILVISGLARPGSATILTSSPFVGARASPPPPPPPATAP